MEKRYLSEKQKEQFTAVLVIILGVIVLLGQIAETKPVFLRDFSDSLKSYLDPVQYIIGMMMINFILVLMVIKKYEQYPNPFLNILKWNFSILLINDFIMMFLTVVKEGNLMAFKSNLTVGVGRSYMLLASVRAISDLTLTSAAMFLLVYGLMRYSTCGQAPAGPRSKLGRIMFGLVVFHWAVSMPVMSGFVNSRTLYAWLLGLSQAGSVAITALIYWVAKEYHQRYHTKFFRYFTWYYGIGLCVAGLVFTYSWGFSGLVQRYPAGESGVTGSFGQFVFCISSLLGILKNYFMYLAITHYAEPQGQSGKNFLENNFESSIIKL